MLLDIVKMFPHYFRHSVRALVVYGIENYRNTLRAIRRFVSKPVVPWLIVIIGLSIVVRVCTSLNLPTTCDEGIIVYQANRVIYGGVPLRDIYTQAPVHLWLVSVFERIFGYNLFAGRMLSVCMSATVVLFIFLMGKELYSKRVGLLASAIYAFGPTIVLHSSIANPKPVAYSLLAIAMYILVLAIKKDKLVYYGLWGSIFGIALWTYRSIALFALICPLFTVYICRSNLKKAVKNIGLMAGGGLVTFGLILWYLASNSSLEFVNYAWGYGGGSGSAIRFAGAGPGLQWSIVDRFSNMDNFLAYFNFHSRILYVMSRDWLYLIIPLLLFISLVVKEKATKHVKLYRLVYLGLMGAFLFVIARGQLGYPRDSWGTYEVAFTYRVLFIPELLALFSFGTIIVSDTIRNRDRAKFADAFLIGWLGAVGLTLFLVHRIHAFYALSLAEVGSLMAGVILDRALARMGSGSKGLIRRITSFENWHIPFFILLFISSLLTTGFSLVSKTPPEFYVPQSVAKEIGEYIQGHTSVDDEIFTLQPVFAVTSNRRIALDRANFYPYYAEIAGVHVPEGIDKYGAAPSIEQLLMHFKAGKIKYVIPGDLSGNALVQDIVELQVLIDDFYENETDIGGFTIYRLSNRAVIGDFWDLCANLPSISAYSEKDMYTYSPERKAFIGKPDYKLIERTDLSEYSKVEGSLKTNQILFHPPMEDGETSFMKFDIPHNQYHSLVTSYGIADEAVNLTQGVAYDIWVSTNGGDSYTQLLSTEVKENIWRTKTFDLTPYQEKDLTFLLFSRGLGGDYYWLQITFRLN